MLTPDEVRHVAMLARLGLTDEEVEMFQGQLGQVLEYIEMLQQVDTSAVEPTAQILSHVNVTRPDRTAPSLTEQEVLLNAPGREDPFFKVPAVLEES